MCRILAQLEFPFFENYQNAELPYYEPKSLLLSAKLDNAMKVMIPNIPTSTYHI